jgi:hypothetical protein
MANIKFSEFTEQSDPANVEFVVGYNGSDNVRISPDSIGAPNIIPAAEGEVTSNTTTGVPFPISSIDTNNNYTNVINPSAYFSIGDIFNIKFNGTVLSDLYTVTRMPPPPNQFGSNSWIQTSPTNVNMLSELQALGWSNGDQVEKLSFQATLSFQTQNGVEYITSEGVIFEGNGTNQVSIPGAVGTKVYLKKFPLVNGGEPVYDYITGLSNNGTVLVKDPVSGNSGIKSTLDFDRQAGYTLGKNAIDLTQSSNLVDSGATSEMSFAVGGRAKASGFRSIAIGYQAYATSSNSTAIGSYTNANGGFSSVLGYGSTASSSFSVSIGFGANSLANYATSCGNSLDNYSQYSTAVGRYNDSSITDVVFQVGSGFNSSNRRNSLEVDNDGYVRLPFIQDYVDDATAAANGVPINGVYRTGSVLKIRVV